MRRAKRAAREIGFSAWTSLDSQNLDYSFRVVGESENMFLARIIFGPALLLIPENLSLRIIIFWTGNVDSCKLSLETISGKGLF